MKLKCTVNTIQNEQNVQFQIENSFLFWRLSTAPPTFHFQGIGETPPPRPFPSHAVLAWSPASRLYLLSTAGEAPSEINEDFFAYTVAWNRETYQSAPITWESGSPNLHKSLVAGVFYGSNPHENFTEMISLSAKSSPGAAT